MSSTQESLGRVLGASTTRFSFGCQPVLAEQRQALPTFGAFIQARPGDGMALYGLVYNVSVADDPFVRQLVAAGIDNEEYIADQRQRRQAPIVVDALAVGYAQGGIIWQRVPPQPPATLDHIFPCNAAETVRFNARLDWLRLVLANPDVPVDALLAAALLNAATSHPPDRREAFLITAGRELARLLAMDPTRLDGILRQLAG